MMTKLNIVLVLMAVLVTQAVIQAQAAEDCLKDLRSLPFLENYATKESADRLYDEMLLQRATQVEGWSLSAMTLWYMEKGSKAEFGAGSNVLVIWKDRLNAETIFSTPNPEVIYAMGYVDLKADGVTVIEAPPKQQGILDDFWHRSLTDVGYVGPDKGEGGNYLKLPPNYQSETPEGYYTFKSPTYKVFVFWRAFRDKETGDVTEAVVLIEQTHIYPLVEKDNQPEMHFSNVSGKPPNMVFPSDYKYLEWLAEFVNAEALDAEDWSMRGLMASLWIEKGDDAEVYTDRCAPGRPFKPAALGQDAIGLLAESQSAMNLAAVEQGELRLRILEPMDGDIFLAGSTVDISVAVDPPLEALDIRIRIPGLGRLEGTNLNDFGYEAVLELPSAFVGPITLIPAITDANGQRIEGDAVTIAVQSVEAPDQIYFIQSDYMLDLDAGEKGQLRLIGAYADGSQRDLTSSATGTNYASTDPTVVVSNSEGLLTPTGAGVATVTAEHFGLTKAATVRVIPLEGLPATEVTSILDVNLGGLRLNRRTGFFVQRLTITNSTDKPMPGPLYVVLGNLPNNVEPIAFDGVTQALLPVGSPYIRMPLIDDGLNLAPSASVSLVLEFINPERLQIQYDLRVFRSMDTP
jgi:hypothetical protein